MITKLFCFFGFHCYEHKEINRGYYDYEATDYCPKWAEEAYEKLDD